MKRFLKTVMFGGFGLAALVGILLAQTTQVSPVRTFTCAAGEFVSALAGTGIFTCTAATANQPTTTPQGRLTLTSGKPVMTSDVTAATTIYYACMNGNVVPIGGSNLTIMSCNLSLALDSTVPRIAAGNNYDIFAVNVAGSAALCAANPWTTGSVGTNTVTHGSLVLEQAVGGIWTNQGSVTNCWDGTTDHGPISANAGTYLGSFYATVNGQTAMQFAPAPANGGTNNFLALYNAYNREPLFSMSQDNTATWTTTNTTWHVANAGGAGSGLNNRITWLDGLGQSRAAASYSMSVLVQAGSAGIIGVIFDATSGSPGGITAVQYDQTGDGASTLAASNSIISLGLHYAQAMEARESGAGTITFDTTSGVSTLMGGLTVSIRM